MIAQEVLQHELAARLAAMGELGDQAVVAVLREVDLAAYVEGALAFALALDAEQAAGWTASLTRTLFLAGDPGHLAARHRPDHVARGGGAAWFGPGRPDDYQALRLLLRAFEGEAPVPALGEPVRVRVPGADGGPHRRLHLDVDRMSWQEHLVHLNHAVCEAALAGDLPPGATLELTHDPAPEPPWLHARVGTDPRDSERLRLFAALVAVDKEPHHGP